MFLYGLQLGNLLGAFMASLPVTYRMLQVHVTGSYFAVIIASVRPVDFVVELPNLIPDNSTFADNFTRFIKEICFYLRRSY
jgi:hypothetical protein